MPQTKESLLILKQYKTPFVIALINLFMFRVFQLVMDYIRSYSISGCRIQLNPEIQIDKEGITDTGSHACFDAKRRYSQRQEGKAYVQYHYTS